MGGLCSKRCRSPCYTMTQHSSNDDDVATARWQHINDDTWVLTRVHHVRMHHIRRQVHAHDEVVLAFSLDKHTIMTAWGG